MTTQPTLAITDIISSLLNDRYDDSNPTFPDGLADLSQVVNGLRTLSKNGRAMQSDESYSIGNMLGHLLKAYIPEDPNIDDLTTTILGLTILIARILRAIPELVPDLSIEEFLIEPTDQQSLIDLGHTMKTIPFVIAPDGNQRPNLSQLPIFHSPISITQQALGGFAKRRIEPFQNSEFPANEAIFSFLEIEETAQESEDWIEDPLNGFDEFFDAYFNQDALEDE
jgi:hypothetical protein